MTIKNAKKCVGLSVLGAVTGALLLATNVHAQPKYDKTIAKAAADQVAKKLGQLRDTIKLDDEIIIVSHDMLETISPRDNFRTNSIAYNRARTIEPTAGYARHYSQASAANVRIIYHGTIIEN